MSLIAQRWASQLSHLEAVFEKSKDIVGSASEAQLQVIVRCDADIQKLKQKVKELSLTASRIPPQDAETRVAKLGSKTANEILTAIGYLRRARYDWLLPQPPVLLYQQLFGELGLDVLLSADWGISPSHMKLFPDDPAVSALVLPAHLSGCPLIFPLLAHELGHALARKPNLIRLPRISHPISYVQLRGERRIVELFCDFTAVLVFGSSYSNAFQHLADAHMLSKHDNYPDTNVRVDLVSSIVSGGRDGLEVAVKNATASSQTKIDYLIETALPIPAHQQAKWQGRQTRSFEDHYFAVETGMKKPSLTAEEAIEYARSTVWLEDNCSAEFLHIVTNFHVYSNANRVYEVADDWWKDAKKKLSPRSLELIEETKHAWASVNHENASEYASSYKLASEQLLSTLDS